jgi:hypothetical protein
MTQVAKGRWTADVPDDGIVVFLIGMRINSFWRFWKWIPVAAAMPRMLSELVRDPNSGLLGRPRTFVSGRVITVLQYWSSFEALESYARDRDRLHLPAWRRFNSKVRANGTVGIFHETYRIAPGASENVYGNMPPFGLGAAVGVTRVGTASQTAATRIGDRPDDTPPVEPY